MPAACSTGTRSRTGPCRLEDRELEHTPRARLRQCGVGGVVGVGLARAQREDEQVGCHEGQNRGGEGHPAATVEPYDRAGDRKGGQRRQGKVRQGQEAPGHARVAERREDVAQRLVERQVRPEGEQRRHERGEAEEDRQPAAAPREQHETGDRQHRQQPAEVDESLGPVQAPAADEVQRGSRVKGDLRERPPFGFRRAGDQDRLGQETRRWRRAHSTPGPERGRPPVAKRRVSGQERQRAEREVELARERERDDACRCERAPQVGGPRRSPRGGSARRPRGRAAAGLRPSRADARRSGESVRRQLEGEPAERRRDRRQVQLAEPEVGKDAGRERDEQEEQVPRDHRPPERVQRPERQARTASRPGRIAARRAAGSCTGRPTGAAPRSSWWPTSQKR